jgi:hypothetical protein
MRKKKKIPQKVYRPKWPSHLVFTETLEMTQNTPKFYPRWNERLPRTGLHTGTRYSARSGRNETELITLLLQARMVWIKGMRVLKFEIST